MPRIYVSPSTQESNIGVGSFGSEEVQMNRITDLLITLLNGDGRFVTLRNSPSMSIYQIAIDSNNFKADLYISIHSNAGGGTGTEVFAYGPGTNSERLAKALYNQIAPLSPGADRGVKFNPGLYEVGDRVYSTSALIELDFHDNVAGAAWIASSHQDIAKALYKGICDYYGYDYRSIAEQPITPPVLEPIITPADISNPTSSSIPLGFTHPNNAKIVKDDLYIRDANGVRISGRYVSKGDNITVLDVSYSKQLVLVEYPTSSGLKSGYVRNIVSYIRYYNQGLWVNGSTPEPVLDVDGTKIGSINPREKATPLYRKNGKLHVVYATDKGDNTKSGYVAYNDGFNKF